MDDYGNLTIPNSFDPQANPYGRSPVPATRDEQSLQNVSLDAYGGYGVDGYGYYEL